MYPNLAAQFG